MLVLFVQLHVMGLVQYFLIVIVNMEYHIIVFIVRDSVFLLISAVPCEFDCRICSSLTVCSQFQYESSTGTRYLKLVLGLEFSTEELGLETWIFNWDSHICRDGHVFTTAKLLLNNVLYHQ